MHRICLLALQFLGISPFLIAAVTIVFALLVGGASAFAQQPTPGPPAQTTPEPTQEPPSTTTPEPTPILGELPADNPPVNFHVTGYSHDYVHLKWGVPRNRDISNYTLQRYDHNGAEYVASQTVRVQGSTSGGSSKTVSDIYVSHDTLYKYSLTLSNAAGTAIIEKSITIRTKPRSRPSLSTDASLSALTLSGIDIGTFYSNRLRYFASVANSVSQTTVTATVNHVGASAAAKIGGVADSDGTVSLAVGSNAITVEVTAEDGIVTRTYTVTVTRAAPPATPVPTATAVPGSTATPVASPQPATGICGRTTQVRAAILSKLDSITDCAGVTATHLSGITSLSLRNTGIATLQEGDFSGLTGLVYLYLDDNSLSTLPDDVFDDVFNLIELHLDNNSISGLSAAVFDQLSKLNHLDLTDNSLTSLASGVFDNLTALKTLHITDNSLSSLPAGAFGELSSLESLGLRGNNLESLPDDIFSGNSSLRKLYLSHNA